MPSPLKPMNSSLSHAAHLTRTLHSSPVWIDSLRSTTTSHPQDKLPIQAGQNHPPEFLTRSFEGRKMPVGPYLQPQVWREPYLSERKRYRWRGQSQQVTRIRRCNPHVPPTN